MGDCDRVGRYGFQIICGQFYVARTYGGQDLVDGVAFVDWERWFRGSVFGSVGEGRGDRRFKI